MRLGHRPFPVFACTLLPLALLSSPRSEPGDPCIAFLTRNLAKGNGNWFTYFVFSTQKLAVNEGDSLVYSIFLDPKNPEPKGGIDMSFTDGSTEFRDLHIEDQNGLRSHGDSRLTKAVGSWYERKIPLDAVKGKTVETWMLNEEGDSFGRYVQFIKNVRVEHKDGSKTFVYQTGPVPTRDVVSHSGYTEYPTCVVIDSAMVDTDLQSAIAKVDVLGEQAQKVAAIEQDLAFAKKFLERNPNPELRQHIEEAEAMLKRVNSEEVSAAYIEETLHAAKHALSHAHPEMEKYTGHLVGHAHIDLQWLWEWQEGMVATYDTFNQATKFMDEFPGFTFSQSSSCLYQTVEETWPDLFKKIRGKVKKGQWELVGGRVCEGDTNMISPESHIRHFLYGQSYFREKFGKTARVGWEPDTFGHTPQMPQILKLGGCDSYYFCRGGKGKPLFWWQGLDGTKILSFDEPATGSWYNSDLSYKQFQEMLDFEKSARSKDSLMVYGIGNHGGGPSREYIETALSWMKDNTKPKVKFSTATQFFDALRKYDLTKIPVVAQELNPVFDGCYTSQSETKQLNRQAEYATGAAESVATVASLFGFAYPGDQFRKNWEDICFNHHHDTLPGSGIHAPYERTKTVLARVLAEDKDIATRALETLSVRVTPQKGGISVMVFNPSGWARSGAVRTYLVKSGWDGGEGIDPKRAVATGPDGKSVPVTELDDASHLAEFTAADVPAFGWKVFKLSTGRATSAAPPAAKSDAANDGSYASIENGQLKVVFDTKRGVIAQSTDIANKQVTNEPWGVPELHTEHDDGMSAWVLGRIQKVAPCTVKRMTSGPDWVAFTYSVPWSGRSQGESTVKQTFRLVGKQIVVDVDCDWHAIGTPGKEAPLLRVAFDSGLKGAKPTYEIPFGSLDRAGDGKECSALNWADVSDGKTGLAVLNDSKSGYSCDGSTLRLSLIRSSTGPDPAPNQGQHHWRYAVVPHAGNWRAANLPRLGQEFQTPLMSATVPFDAHGDAPLQWSLLSATDPNVLITGVKRAERGGGVIAHLYDSGGQGSKGSVSAGAPLESMTPVNFLEDAVGKATPGLLELHPFEIKCFRLTFDKRR